MQPQVHGPNLVYRCVFFILCTMIDLMCIDLVSLSWSEEWKFDRPKLVLSRIQRGRTIASPQGIAASKEARRLQLAMQLRVNKTVQTKRKEQKGNRTAMFVRGLVGSLPSSVLQQLSKLDYGGYFTFCCYIIRNLKRLNADCDVVLCTLIYMYTFMGL